MRLINGSAQQIGVVKLEEAKAAAVEEGLDLVEVAPTSNPPVCRILDYGKFKYEQRKKEQQAKHKQHTTQIKEVRLRLKTEAHDFDFKVKRALEFLGKRDKVLISLRLRGRENQHADMGREQVGNFCAQLLEVGKMDGPVRQDGSRISATLSPK